MEIRYYAKPGRAGKSLFVALYGPEGESLISTGEKLSKDDWDEKRKQPKGKILTRASLIISEVQKTRDLLFLQGLDVTPTTVKAAYLKKRMVASQETKARELERKKDAHSISGLADQWIQAHLFGYKPSTQKSIKESITAFKEFLNGQGLSNIGRKELSYDVIRKYERHLLEEINLSNSTHGKRMKHLRWFLRSLDFDTSKIKLRVFQRPILSLDNNELEALENFQVDQGTERQKAKDLFLLGCYTGQRISDIKHLRPSSLHGDELRLKQTKTGKDVFIPLLPQTAAILARYNGHAPKLPEQHLNEHIKKICRDAGIVTMVSHVTNKGGLDIRKDVPKYQLITSHISGKTFISTVAPLRYKLTPPEIAAVCGKNLKTLLAHYFNLPRETAKQKMLGLNSGQMLVAK